uniref:NADH dehydrogenase subunit 2 n=1 Tax=Thelazia callipaeda TaxID=103827 RepID=A0A343IPF7_THECL|nr:NADH dehydrogenase subunit 2 [Thelazia callipaeda]
MVWPAYFVFFCFFYYFVFKLFEFLCGYYFIWWSIFIICTFFFVFLGVGNVSAGALFNYFMIQEVSGYYFLLFGNWKMQFFFLLLKSGSAPFHFWLFSVLRDVKKWFFLWFLTFQKLPYFFVIVNFCSDFFFVVLLLGMVFCYLQIFFLRDVLDMIVIASVESFNWLLFLSVFSFNEIFFFVFFYYFVMVFFIFYGVKSGGFFNYELVMVFFNVPLSVTFFLKLLLLFSSGFYVGFFYLFLLFFMVIMSLSISSWFFYVSMISFNLGLKCLDYFFYIFFCFMLFLYF